MQNFSSLKLYPCTQTDLDKFLTIFEEKFKIFLKKIWNFPNLKFWIEIPKRHLIPNFESSSNVWKFSKLFSNFFDSWVFKGILKFQNSKHDIHQVGVSFEPIFQLSSTIRKTAYYAFYSISDRCLLMFPSVMSQIIASQRTQGSSNTQKHVFTKTMHLLLISSLNVSINFPKQ
jgi:hypothetical protein